MVPLLKPEMLEASCLDSIDTRQMQQSGDACRTYSRPAVFTFRYNDLEECSTGHIGVEPNTRPTLGRFPSNAMTRNEKCEPMLARSASFAQPNHCGLCAVPSKLVVVLYPSNSPFCAASFVFASSVAICVSLNGLNVFAAVTACSTSCTVSHPVITTLVGRPIA